MDPEKQTLALTGTERLQSGRPQWARSHRFLTISTTFIWLLFAYDVFFHAGRFRNPMTDVNGLMCLFSVLLVTINAYLEWHAKQDDSDADKLLKITSRVLQSVAIAFAIIPCYNWYNEIGSVPLGYAKQIIQQLRTMAKMQELSGEALSLTSVGINNCVLLATGAWQNSTAYARFGEITGEMEVLAATIEAVAAGME
ncbi:hypothetical protein PMZ80_004197 [Knufia obscura]|uniref:Uncharacterized protein n=1 Tax=Knufia obscura TaxID=1635080 RepID=A0ABR0RRD7_9EURO|nr:hypothetical protein PMZ80_004197 [Knufia obscura]